MALAATLFCLSLTGWGLQLELDHNREADRQRFNVLVERLKFEIRQRAQVYRAGLLGFRSLYVASQAVARDEFRRAVAVHDLHSEFPGAYGIGFIRRCSRAELPQFLAATRADGAPDFQLRTSGEHDTLLVIEFIEPASANRAALGFDIAQEPRRREAAERAMSSGEATLTAKLTLVQATRSGPGFLYLVPIYRNGVPTATPAERRAALAGWVYMPIVAAQVFHGAGDIAQGELAFEVFEGETPTPEGLLYDNDGELSSWRAGPTPEAAAWPEFTSLAALTIGGRVWTTAISPSPKFRAQPRSTAWAIGVGGTAFALLLGLLLHAQATAMRRAQALADSMTAGFRVAQRRAEDASRSKSEFLANMSHEIRTPMTAILGYADLLAEEGSGAATREQRAEYCGTIKRNGEHLLAIINDILDVSKIEAGMLRVERTATAIEPLVLEIITLMKFNARARGLTLELVTRPDVPATVQTDPLRLRQILINLIGNAVKFTEKGGVVVTLSREAQHLRFDVADTGIGFTPEQGTILFAAFAQADSSATRRFGGTGLGLRISKRLAQMLGGDITFTSESCKGSVFSATIELGAVSSTSIPANNNASSKPAAGSIATPVTPRPLEGVRVLLAEDGPDNRLLISRHLQKAGALVQIVENGKLAVEFLSTDGTVDGPLINPLPVDVILTDMQMPEMDGYLAAEKLREKGCKLPIIALTAHTMRGDAERCLEAGCDAYAAKPIDRLQLIEMCRRASAGELHGERLEPDSVLPKSQAASS